LSDFIDVPLAEASEAYRVTILRGGVPVRSAAVTSPTFHYAAIERRVNGSTGAIKLRVSQVSVLVGPGAAAVATFTLA
jgi:hypothetical protein